MKVDLGKSGIVDITGDVLQTMAVVTGKDDQRYLCNTVRASYRHLTAVLAQKVAQPELDDVDGLLAAHLVENPVPGVDAERLALLLEAWEAAERSLSPAARLALRACSRLVEAVLRSPDKAAFDRLVPGLIEHLDDEAAGLCADYIAAVRDEMTPSRKAAPRLHYLQRRIARMRLTLVAPAVDARGLPWVVKRLTAAQTAVAPA